MVLKADGKILKYENSTFYLAIRARMFYDSQFPFDAGEEVDVEIKGDQLTARKKPDEEKEPKEEDHPTT